MVENVISRLHFAIERFSTIRKIEETRKFDQAKMIYHEFKKLRKYLKVVKSDIRKKVSQINGSYKGGFWPQSTANITQIHYLKDVLRVINQFGVLLFITNRVSECILDPLEHILTSGELLNAPKLKATFLLYETFTWPSFESVYEAFTRDMSCEVDLVYIPFRNKNPNNIDWFSKYKDMNLPVVNGEDLNKNARTKIKKVELSFDEEFSVGEAIKKICLEGIAHEEKYTPAREQEAKKQIK